MKHPLLLLPVITTLILGAATATARAQAPEPVPAPEYHTYMGNTHSHTSYTWSHGSQWQKGGMEVRNGVSYPKKDDVLKPNWKDIQGPPSRHFELAKANGFDFYIITDHSQESAFHPTSPDNPAWLDVKRSAAAATNANFVGIAGFEYSENDGPDGKGHINVFNSDTYLNALEKGMDLHYLYKWLPTAKPNGAGPVVASFNHPGPTQYNSFDFRTPAATEMIAMFEIVTGANFKENRLKGYINALDKGWKVAPNAVLDNHGTDAIKTAKSRTYVLATAKTKEAILDAMKHRRVYAALCKTLECRYTVNGQVMGSTLDAPAELQFDIYINDSKTADPARKITKIEILTNGGKVAKTYEPKPAHTVRWKPLIKEATGKYYFVRVWSAGGGDGKDPDPKSPVAYLAPVWTGR